MNFLKGCDEFNLIYRNKIFSQGFYLCFILIGMMTITILLIGKMNLCYFLAIEFFLPGIYVIYKTMKEGLLIPRIKASKKNTRKRYILILLIVFLCILGSDWEFLKSDKSLIMKTARIMFDILMDILFIIIPTHFAVKALGKKSQENDKKFNN
ncbi:hypothetical protein [Clostridium tarantellae]|uniref:Uncharacterized protein n=1 Tax=Clostridium tarantellae TaxID=39493 RepID=A0A6I1MW15_9CLOT|nr:hypothetical protein [Clostridium tarantellae]MPQ45011.1 hypothetical protein [Clostridium tarantellae]